MDNIIFPLGERLSRPIGEFIFYPLESPIRHMQTVEETRRLRLQMLVNQHNGMANLCEKLGYARNETATLTRILNANVRHDRGGKPYNMGSPMAREIENMLRLEPGWMDTPPSYSEMNGQDDPISKALDLMAAMEPEARYQALRLLDAIAQPPKANGTSGHH
jgi:hypothetical protein